MIKSVIPLLTLLLLCPYWISQVSTHEIPYLFRVPIPHQLGNIIDLLAPIHIRFSTDGFKHPPVIRFPLLDLISRGQIFNKPGIHHLIHGPGIPW